MNSSNKIGYGFFYNCTSLTSFRFPETLAADFTISGQTNGQTDLFGAFENCTALQEVILPKNVKTIEGAAFRNCTSLKEIDLTTTASAMSFSLGSQFAYSGLQHITLPSSINNFGTGHTFKGCEQLESVTIDATAGKIGLEMFYGCTALRSVEFTENAVASLTSIDARAFGDCTALTSFTIPANVTTMGKEVFSGWLATQTIHLPKKESLLGWDESWKYGCFAQILDPDGN